MSELSNDSYQFITDEFNRKCVEFLINAPNRQSRNCLFSALRYIDKAYIIRKIDPEMCVFRLITSKEEAASGIMYLLKEMGFYNAKRLKPHNHKHKNAFHFFCKSIIHKRSALFHQSGIELSLRISSKQLWLRMKHPALKGVWATPEPPFNLIASLNGEKDDFSLDINSLVKRSEIDDLSKFLSEEARVRNLLLYADSKGAPCVDAVDDLYFDSIISDVMLCIKIYLLIFPHKNINEQQFVADALSGFNEMVKGFN